MFNNPYTYRDLHGEFAFAIPLLFLGAEVALPAISACLTAVTYTAAAGTVAYGGYKLVESINNQETSSKCSNIICSNNISFYRNLSKSYDFDFTYKKKDNRISSDEPDSPPYRGDVLGDNPAKPPGKGFEWKGKGAQGSKQGSWVKGPKGLQEKLHPDLNHPEPIGPHWDYEGPGFESGARLFPDGTWSPK